MLPKAIPLLTKEQFMFLENEVHRKPTREEIVRLEEAKRVYEKYPVKEPDKKPDEAGNFMEIVIDVDGTILNTPEVMKEIAGVKTMDELYKMGVGAYYDAVWEDWWKYLKPYDGALEGIKELTRLPNVMIVLATRQANQEEVKSWYAWLKNELELGSVKLRFYSHKDMTERKFTDKTGIMVEDSWNEMKDFDGVTILMAKDENKKYSDKPSLYAKNWNEIVEFIKGIWDSVKDVFE
jgi:5'(3')-deoxyribonucleotidase